MTQDNSQTIEDAVIVTLPQGERPTEHTILERATAFRATFPVTDDEFAALIRRIHAKLSITLDPGTSIVAEHQPWLRQKKATIDPFYWERYRKYLLGKLKWPPLVTNTLDQVTDDILDLAGDPLAASAYSRKGLIVGEVQSGKTATYTALCCKAADAGYKLVILLTGTVESLRRQTQERLDEGFAGRDSLEALQTSKSIHPNVAIGAGEYDRRRFAVVFTSRSRDFSMDVAKQLNFSIANAAQPILLVCKKNTKILENLRIWLGIYNSDDSGRIDAPLLLIDDEADNASINTNDDTNEATRTNAEIRQLLKLFNRSCYVGVTATPFANVFIQPDTADLMFGDDLFPKDFIYSLESPTNYIGPRTIFDESTDVFVRSITDMEPYLPLKHRMVDQISALPDSLKTAIRSFLLATTIRDLRGEGPTHRSMLINVSRFVDIQKQIVSLTHSELDEIKRQIRLYAKLNVDEACERSGQLLLLRVQWDREFNTGEHTWQQVQAALNESIQPTVVREVNGKAGPASIDYKASKEFGLRIIAVGGNSLSRGLTLEGLSTSYFYRNSQMYDTLLQMGRWFGYRPGYDDLCRVWMTDDAVTWYSHITLATDELRREFKRMRDRGQTPRDFGLRVRAHPDSLIVTARNKMRSAKDVVHYVSFSGVGAETVRLSRSREINDANLRETIAFAERLPAQLRVPARRRWHPFWSGIPKAEIASYLARFNSNSMNFHLQLDAVAEFVAKSSEPRLQQWDVAIISPQRSAEASIQIGDLAFYPVERRVVPSTENPGVLLISGTKQRVGSIDDESEGLTDAELAAANREAEKREKTVSGQDYRDTRQRPLLLIYFIRPKRKLEDVAAIDPTEFSEPLVALSLSFPRFNDAGSHQKAIYKVNVVEWRSRMASEMEPDGDVADEFDEAS